MTEIRELFDLTKTIAADLFAGKTYPWEVLADIRPFILRLGETLPEDEFDHPSGSVSQSLRIKGLISARTSQG